MAMLRILLAIPGTLLACVVAVPVLLAGVPFLAMAWLVRRLYRGIRRLHGARAVGEGTLSEYDPVLGWQVRAHLDAHTMAVRPFRRITTDAHGWRGPGTLEESDLVVFGDSFAFGYGADDAVHFAFQRGAPRVKVVAANGYNLVQELLYMERLANRLRGRTAVWFVYYGNDLYDSLRPSYAGYRTPFVRLRGGREWEIVTSHITPEPWQAVSWGIATYKQPLVEACCRGPLADRAYAACEFLLARGQAICEAAGARLVVLGVPDGDQLAEEGRRRLAGAAPDPASFDAALPDERLREICGRLDVPFVSLTPLLSSADYSGVHDHWTPRGHRRVARVLARIHADSVAAPSDPASGIGESMLRPALAPAPASESPFPSPIRQANA